MRFVFDLNQILTFVSSIKDLILSFIYSNPPLEDEEQDESQDEEEGA